MMHAVVDICHADAKVIPLWGGGRGIAIMLTPYVDKLVMSTTAGGEECLLKT